MESEDDDCREEGNRTERYKRNQDEADGDYEDQDTED